MAKTKTKGSMEDKRKKDELTSHRILIMFGICLGALLLLMLFNRLLYNPYYIYPLVMACGYIAIGLAVCALVGLGYMAYLWRTQPKHPNVMRFLNISAVLLVLAGCLGLIRYRNLDVFPFLYTALIAIAFLYLIFHIYPKDLFGQAVMIGCAAGLLYAFSKVLARPEIPNMYYILYGAATLLLIAAAGVTYYLMKHQGRLGSIRLLGAGANYPLLFVTEGVLLAALLVALLTGATVAFWLMIGVLAYLFVLAVYYTVKLM